MTDFAPTTLNGLLTLWDFNTDSKSTVEDQAPTGGFENGLLQGKAEADHGWLELDGNHAAFVAKPDNDWQLDEGRIELVFNQDKHVGSSNDTLISRDSNGLDQGGHLNIGVTQDGAIEVRHQDDSQSFFYKTNAKFFEPGDDVRVTYAWDSDGKNGFFKVENLSESDPSKAVFEIKIDEPLTLDNGSTSEPFSVGASQRVSSDNEADNLKEFFDGEIAYVAIFDTPVVNGATPAGPDFIVSGTDGADVIDAGYTGDPDGDIIDANDNATGGNEDLVDAGAGDDTVKAGAADDTVFAGSGDDSVQGAGGNDVIFGDSSLGTAGPALVRESFEWDKINSGQLTTDNGSVTQDTGNVNVTFTIDSDDDVSNRFEATQQNVTGIDTGSEAITPNSSFESLINDEDDSGTYSFEFDKDVENVSFRVNDIDGDGVVKVTAFKDGAPVEIELTAGANLTLLDTDGVPGADTADSQGGYEGDSSPNYSILVSIPGPVDKIVIQHDMDDDDNSGVNITDVYFDAPADAGPEGSGDDTLIGGGGADLIYGEQGDDSIQGNSGNDTLFGDDPAEGTPIGPNLVVNGSFEDTTGLTPTGYGFVGNGAVPGWTDANGDPIDIHDDMRGGVDPTDGTNWLDLEASPGNVRVGQDIEGIQDGETYKLTFDAGDADFAASGGSGENLVNVYWGGQLVGQVDPQQGQMTGFEFDLVGGAGDGSNRLEFEGTGTEDNIGASIDSVSIVLLAGPEGAGGNDTIEGGSGADIIAGQDGSDELSGGDGDDTITGGSGDVIVGGEGSDSIVIDVDELDENGENDGAFKVDGSTEGADNDTLDLTNFEAFRNLVETDDGDDVPSTSGTVEVRNADGEWITVTFAEIENLLLPPALPDGIVDGEDSGEAMDVGYDDANLPNDGGGDQITNGDDSIRGNGGDDTIKAGGGNDTVDGGDDDDQISGGAGDDSLLGGDGEDEMGGGLGDDTLEGGAGDDLLIGGDETGNDSLDGGLGDDTLKSGAGDTLIGGEGSDSIVIDPDDIDASGDNTAPIFVDGSTEGTDNDTLDLTNFEAFRNLVETDDGDDVPSTSGTVEVQNTDGEWITVTFAEIENLLLPPALPDGVVDGEDFAEVMNPGYNDNNAPNDGGGDQIDGTDGLNDSIRGNGGDDTINAGQGDDSVDGGTGNDDIFGGAGEDTLLGGDGDDSVVGGEGDDELRGNLGNDTLEGGGGNDSMGGAEGDDSLVGGQGENTLTGGSGNDTLEAGSDNDTITGGSGNDVVNAGQGDNIVNAGILGTPDRGFPEVTITSGPFTGTVIPGVPADSVAPGDPNDDLDLVTTGAGNDTITTGDDDDTINAGNGNNLVDAGFDDDDVTTGTGNDTITLGEGSDTVSAGFGDDLIYGGVGPGFPDIANVADDGVGSAIGPDPVTDNGDDLIFAGGGNDTVFGEDDDDTIIGGDGDDLLDGGVDEDLIEGNDQDDTIIGGHGADTLDGGRDADTFIIGQFGGQSEGIGDVVIGGEGASTGVDNDTLDLSGAGPLKIIYDEDLAPGDQTDPGGTAGEAGKVIFYADAAQTIVSGEMTFKEIENVIPCFTPGTLIATPKGEVPVESLREGDKVITRDNGIQEIRWVGSRTLNRDDMANAPSMRPIVIKAGSLGHGLPERDMLVSPQHRVLVTGDQAQLYFDESEVLVAAKHLINSGSIRRLDTLRTTYIHFMFDRHEVVLSDGAWTESFQPGDQSLGGMGQDQRNEIFALFPELASQDGLSDYAAARRSLKAHEARLLKI
jgi:Ca2+-binding RTX toxin-like protein